MSIGLGLGQGTPGAILSLMYIYHRVPDNMTGVTLHPLNRLRDVFPEAYTQHASKYKGREAIRKKTIPILGCLWNDVLHFTAVHPSTLKQALIDSGANNLSNQKMSYYKIPSELLEQEKSIVYLYKPEYGRGSQMSESNFEKYFPNMVGRYSAIPIETLQYYSESFSEGRRPLMFVHIPHILYQGGLDISGCEIIQV